MWCKLISVAILYFTSADSLEETYQHDFSIALAVITNQNIELSKVVQFQNEQILRKLENMNLELESLKNQHTRLETIELQNQKDLKHINFTLTNNTARSQFSTILPKNCKEVQGKGESVSKVYIIKPELSSGPFSVLCDMETKGGGWTYILNRFDGSQNFNLNWTDYKKGFGSLSGEFWIGLDPLYQLIGQKPKELLVELADWNHTKAFAHFDNFSIGNEEESYILKSVGNCSGDAGNSMTDHVGRKFSTKDRDQDVASYNCAKSWNGAWWFVKCFGSHLFGKYINGFSTEYGRGIQWFSFRNTFNYNLKEAKMMIR